MGNIAIVALLISLYQIFKDLELIGGGTSRILTYIIAFLTFIYFLFDVWVFWKNPSSFASKLLDLVSKTFFGSLYENYKCKMFLKYFSFYCNPFYSKEVMFKGWHYSCISFNGQGDTRGYATQQFPIEVNSSIRFFPNEDLDVFFSDQVNYHGSLDSILQNINSCLDKSKYKFMCRHYSILDKFHIRLFCKMNWETMVHECSSEVYENHSKTPLHVYKAFCGTEGMINLSFYWRLWDSDGECGVVSLRCGGVKNGVKYLHTEDINYVHENIENSCRFWDVQHEEHGFCVSGDGSSDRIFEEVDLLIKSKLEGVKSEFMKHSGGFGNINVFNVFKEYVELRFPKNLNEILQVGLAPKELKKILGNWQSKRFLSDMKYIFVALGLKDLIRSDGKIGPTRECYRILKMVDARKALSTPYITPEGNFQRDGVKKKPSELHDFKTGLHSKADFLRIKLSKKSLSLTEIIRIDEINACFLKVNSEIAPIRGAIVDSIGTSEQIDSDLFSLSGPIMNGVKDKRRACIRDVFKQRYNKAVENLNNPKIKAKEFEPLEPSVLKLEKNEGLSNTGGSSFSLNSFDKGELVLDETLQAFKNIKIVTPIPSLGLELESGQGEKRKQKTLRKSKNEKKREKKIREKAHWSSKAREFSKENKKEKEENLLKLEIRTKSVVEKNEKSLERRRKEKEILEKMRLEGMENEEKDGNLQDFMTFNRVEVYGDKKFKIKKTKKKDLQDVKNLFLYIIGVRYKLRKNLLDLIKAYFSKILNINLREVRNKNKKCVRELFSTGKIKEAMENIGNLGHEKAELIKIVEFIESSIKKEDDFLIDKENKIKLEKLKEEERKEKVILEMRNKINEMNRQKNKISDPNEEKGKEKERNQEIDTLKTEKEKKRIEDRRVMKEKERIWLESIRIKKLKEEELKEEARAKKREKEKMKKQTKMEKERTEMAAAASKRKERAKCSSSELKEEKEEEEGEEVPFFGLFE